MRSESFTEKVAHVADDNEDEVAAISGLSCWETRNSPHVSREKNKVGRSSLFRWVDRLIRVPLRCPPPVWVVVVSKLAVLDRRFDIDKRLLQVVLVHLGELFAACIA